MTGKQFIKELNYSYLRAKEDLLRGIKFCDNKEFEAAIVAFNLSKVNIGELVDLIEKVKTGEQ